MQPKKLLKDAEFLVIDFETITPKGRLPEPIEVGVLRIKESDLENKLDARRVMSIIDKSCSKKDYIFMAQNAKYEANILSHYTDGFKGIAKTPIIDTILLAKKILPQLPNYKLDTLANALEISIPKDRHRALADCFLTAQVYLKLLELQKNEKEILYLDELLKIAEIQTKYNKPRQLNLLDFI